ncbi:YcxB family protein [Bosea thiooxidans]|nr:YcxB family protein [Bosea sp. (in: a-proteobacteria)]
MARREAVVEIGVADLVAAQRLVLRACFRRSSQCWKRALLWGFATAFFAMLLLGEIPGSPAGAIAISAFGSLLLVFGLPVVIVLLLGPRAAHCHFRAVPAFQAPLHYSWDEEGFSSETVSGRSMHRWPSYRRWLENDRLLLLWPYPATYQIVPKRALAPGRVEELRSFLSQTTGT